MLIPPAPVLSGGSRTGIHAVLVAIAAVVFRVALGCLGVLAFGLRIFTSPPSSAAAKSSNDTREPTESDAVSTLKCAATHRDV
jgi:hypothetical protein